jgi:uncharacterized protein YxjI
MDTFKVEPKKSVYYFTNEETKETLFSLKFKSSLSTKASFVYKNDEYIIESNSWGSKYKVLNKSKEIAELDMDMSGSFTLRVVNNEGMTKHFILKPKSTFSTEFILSDFLTNHLYAIKSKFSWTKMKFEIQTLDGWVEEDNKVDKYLLLHMVLYAYLVYMTTPFNTLYISCVDSNSIHSSHFSSFVFSFLLRSFHLPT